MRSYSTAWSVGLVLTPVAFGGYFGDSITTSALMTTTQTVYLSTSEHPDGSLSNLSLDISFWNLQSMTLTRPVAGNAMVQMALDGTYSGSLEVIQGTISVGDGTNTFSGFALNGSLTTSNVSGSLLLGSELVVNRDLEVDDNSIGGVILDSGALQLTITGGVLAPAVTTSLGTNSYLIDLSSDPISFLFSDLGTTVLNATADDDSVGLDSDGAELNLPLQLSSSIYGLFGGPVDSNVTTSGFLYLGSTSIPEFSALGLFSIAVAASGGAILLRRRRSSR